MKPMIFVLLFSDNHQPIPICIIGLFLVLTLMLSSCLPFSPILQTQQPTIPDNDLESKATNPKRTIVIPPSSTPKEDNNSFILDDRNSINDQIIAKLNKIKAYKFSGNQENVDDNGKTEYKVIGAFMQPNTTYLRWELPGTENPSGWAEILYTDFDQCYRNANTSWDCSKHQGGDFLYSPKGLIRLVEGKPLQTSSISGKLIKAEYQELNINSNLCHLYSVQEQQNIINSTEDQHFLSKVEICFTQESLFPQWMQSERITFLGSEIYLTAGAKVNFFDFNKPVESFIPKPPPLDN